MNYKECKEKLKRYSLARIPFIPFYTIERQRALDILRETAKDLSLPFYVHTLSKGMYDYLKQRILVNYKLEGLNRQDIKEYVKTRLQLANVNHDLFSEDALNALYSCSHSSFRRLNTLILNCLLLGYQKKKETIDSEIVRVAKGEIDLE